MKDAEPLDVMIYGTVIAFMGALVAASWG